MRLNFSEYAPGFAEVGIALDGQDGFYDPRWKKDFGLALDAQPQLATTQNSGIPAYLSTLIDPDVIEVVLAPLRLAEVFGEEKVGDWTKDLVEFMTVEPTGFVTSYGDWNNNGNTGANVQYTPRQNYEFQTIQQYGDRELARWGLTRLDLVAQLDKSAAFNIQKFFNNSYAFGVSGLINYGALNDPNILPPITPLVKAAGGYTWQQATAQEIFNDFLALFGQLQTQMGGNITQNDKIVVVLSPGRMVRLSAISGFNIPAIQSIREAFPSITFEGVPEYSTTGGEVMQMFVKDFQGTSTATTAYTEKLRLFPIIRTLSASQQKKAAGTWGWILKRPIALATMLGL